MKILLIILIIKLTHSELININPLTSKSLGYASISLENAGLIFFAGGQVYSKPPGLAATLVTTNIIDIYNISNNTWSTAELSAPRSGIVATSLEKNNLALFAGGSSNIIDIYNANTNKLFALNFVSGFTPVSATSIPNQGLAYFLQSNRIFYYNVSANNTFNLPVPALLNGNQMTSLPHLNLLFVVNSNKNGDSTLSLYIFNITSEIWDIVYIPSGYTFSTSNYITSIHDKNLIVFINSQFTGNMYSFDFTTKSFRNTNLAVSVLPVIANALVPLQSASLLFLGMLNSGNSAGGVNRIVNITSNIATTMPLTTVSMRLNTGSSLKKLILLRACSTNSPSPDDFLIPLANCEPGFYLSINPTECLKIPAGYYCDTGYCTSYKICQQGNYCPEGSTNQIQCPAGKYNPNTGSGNLSSCLTCPEGYYCQAPYITPTICPAGYYCPQGSGSFSFCPLGTYSPNQGATNVSACITCPSGYFCSSGTSNPTICPMGSYCPVGSSSSIICQNGYYCPLTGMNSSIICPVGYYCVKSIVWNDNTISTIRPIGCDPGYYCPLGTGMNYVENSGFIQLLKCIPGTYCPDGKYQIPCPIGTFCPNNQMILPIMCPAGYYCPNLGSLSLCKLDTSKGFVCPEDQAIACPTGKYNPTTGKNTSNDCLYCPAGYYCPNTAMNSFLSYPCQKGYICPIGSENQIMTPPGTYAPSNLMSIGLKCPSRFYCPVGSINPLACTQGSYCPEGSSTPLSCQTGMYNDLTNSSSILDCVKCPEGTYNNFGTGSISICKPCAPGYYCPAGTSLPQPCSANYYCPNGQRMIPCPAGTYYESVGASDIFYCKPCQKGYYCPGGGTTAVTCTPGSFSNKFGSIFCETCPEGFFCPFGAVEPLVCTMNTYASKGSPACTPCDNGQYTEKAGSSVCMDCSGNRFQISGWWCMTTYDKALFIIVWVGSIISGVATIKKIRDEVRERMKKIKESGLVFTWSRFFNAYNLPVLPLNKPPTVLNNKRQPSSRHIPETLKKAPTVPNRMKRDMRDPRYPRNPRNMDIV